MRATKITPATQWSKNLAMLKEVVVEFLLRNGLKGLKDYNVDDLAICSKSAWLR